MWRRAFGKAGRPVLIIGFSATEVFLSRNASAVSDAPHERSAGRFVGWCGARPIQLFEGSRPWVGGYAN
jgi:hypothetical protein